jgi:predicted RNA-binding Zn ribbon-like protein
MVTDTDLIKHFVNSWDLLEGEDSLSTQAQLVAWLASHDLVDADARATASELRQARELREALRALLLANNGVEVDAAPANDVLDDVARRAGVELRFRDGRAGLVPRKGGVAGALGRIVAAVQATMAGEAWERLKACRAEDCRWVFLDDAKNHSRAWCSMKVCGNRAKARAYRERHRATSS